MYRTVRSGLTLLVMLGSVGVLTAADEAMPTSTWYPLGVGATWTYRAGENRFQMKVTEIKTVEGKPRAKIELVVGNKTVSHEQVGISKDSVLRYTFEGKEAKPPIEFFQVPPKTDATWKVESRVDGQLMKGAFKVGKSETITVPAGKYTVYPVVGQDIEANGVKMTLSYYFAERVGMVKQVIELAGQRITIELEKYEPGKEK
ncbi:MAG: hypothetical protein U0840_22965 [Gemmataceae bacterium]